jgi:hypothetical protein
MTRNAVAEETTAYRPLRQRSQARKAPRLARLDTCALAIRKPDSASSRCHPMNKKLQHDDLATGLSTQRRPLWTERITKSVSSLRQGDLRRGKGVVALARWVKRSPVRMFGDLETAPCVAKSMILDSAAMRAYEPTHSLLLLRTVFPHDI